MRPTRERTWCGKGAKEKGGKLTSTADFPPTNRALGLAGTQALEVAYRVPLSAYRLWVEEHIQTHLQQIHHDTSDDTKGKRRGRGVAKGAEYRALEVIVHWCDEQLFCNPHRDAPRGAALSQLRPLGSFFATNCQCNHGYTGLDTHICTECTAGMYKDSKGSHDCIYCPRGKYISTSGASECADCTVGTYSNKDVCMCSYNFTDGNKCDSCNWKSLTVSVVRAPFQNYNGDYEWVEESNNRAVYGKPGTIMIYIYYKINHWIIAPVLRPGDDARVWAVPFPTTAYTHEVPLSGPDAL